MDVTVAKGPNGVEKSVELGRHSGCQTSVRRRDPFDVVVVECQIDRASTIV